MNLNMKIDSCQCDTHWDCFRIEVPGEKPQVLNVCKECGNTWFKLEKTGMRPYPYHKALERAFARRN